MTARPTRRGLLAGAAGLTAATACGAQQDYPGLAEMARWRGVVFGAAVEPDNITGDPAFAALLRRECASLTPENHMKWNALRPAPRQFDFAGADRVVAAARAQNASVHGHALVWHEANPDWLARELSPRTGEEILREHIGTVVGRYAGRVRSWDVVNEAVERNDRRPDGLRRSVWLEALDADYIPLAFEAARRADPSAALVLSDYGLEYDDESWMREKRGTMLELLAGWKRAGVPIDALGLQGHLLGDRPAAFGAGLRTFLRQVRSLDLDIFITELDVNDQKVTGTIAQRDDRVAGIYNAFLSTVLAEPGVKMVATWGLSDRYTSKADMFPRADAQPVRPLPFDRDLNRKPAWFALADAFTGR
ncbi:MAG: endo-1,4-beta-xylanase [Caulobacter sp.]|nr:endo-1,4-beta-xylanase [Caulobacter sp.]